MPSKKSLKQLHIKRLKGGSSKKKRRKSHGFKGHDKYYQSLYNKYYSDSSNDLLVKRITSRNSEIDHIKDEINKLNSLKKDDNDSKFRELNDLQKQLERQNIIDQQVASSLKMGNSISYPIAKNLRESDDQKIFGSQIYANSHKPDYMGIAKKQAEMKVKLNQYMSDPINQMKMQMQMV